MVVKQRTMTMENWRAREDPYGTGVTVSIELIVDSVFRISYYQLGDYSLVWEFPDVICHLIVIFSIVIKYSVLKYFKITLHSNCQQFHKYSTL